MFLMIVDKIGNSSFLILDSQILGVLFCLEDF